MRVVLLITVLMLARIGNAVAELEQRTQSFTISLKGSVADVTPLLGPVREAEWAPGWAPISCIRLKAANAKARFSRPLPRMAGKDCGCLLPTMSRKAESNTCLSPL